MPALFLVINFAGAEKIYVSRNRSLCPMYCYEDIAEALESVKAQGAEVLIFPGEYRLNRSITFTRTSNISLSRYDPHDNINTAVQIVCEGRESGAGLTFLYSNDIFISGLSFQGCGVQHNSTTIAQQTDAGYIEFYAALYFAFCDNFSFTSNKVNGSKGIAVQLYAIQGITTITNNEFSNNPYPSYTSKGGGLYIELPYCSPFNFSLCGIENSVPDITVTNATYVISNNVFKENNASDSFTGAVFILPNIKLHNVFGRGGGLSIYSKGDSSYNTFTIENNNFTDNIAYFGGGMLIEFQDNSNHNNVIVRKCHFKSNNALKSGGGVRLSIFLIGEGKTLYNTIKFIGNIFSGNKAAWGGGMSVEITKERNTVIATNSILLSDCDWLGNTARLGSGLDITRSYSNVNDVGALANIVLDGCTFSHNSVKYSDDSNQEYTIQGYGALYADAVSITFTKSVTFSNNYDGGALVATDNTITFASNCKATFLKNLGRDGPGITILAFSYIIIEQNTTLNFTKNQATNEGGAIFAFRAGGRNLLSSRDCFMRYINQSCEPDEWETTITFDSNTANGRHNAIFTTSVYPCLWGRDHGPNHSNLTKEVFCWKSFVYKSAPCKDQITTDPASFEITNKTLYVVPGNTTSLGIIAYNDKDDDVTNFLVLTAQTEINSEIAVDSTSKYISDDSVLLRKKQHNHKNRILILESEGPRVIRAEINIQFLPCPPGLINSTTEDDALSCNCPPYGSFNDYILCESRSQVRILKGYWIGSGNTTGGKIKVGDCKYCTVSKHESTGSHTTLKSSSTEVEEQLCGAENRRGVLCGSCKEQYGPAINSYGFQCVECPHATAYAWAIYIGLRVIMPFSIFLLLFLSKFSIASGYLNGPIFFAQAITTITIQHLDQDSIFGKIYHALYGVWNLDFCISCFPMPCLHPKLRGVDLLLLDYAIAFIPLLFVLFFKVLDVLKFFRHKPFCATITCTSRSGFFSRLTNHEVIRNGIIASIILSYNKVAVMTAYLITPARLYGTNDTESHYHYVLYFDGNIEFNSNNHRKFAIPALIISSIFLLFIPFVLIIYRYEKFEENDGFFNHLFILVQKEFRPKKESNVEELNDISNSHSNTHNPIYREPSSKLISYNPTVSFRPCIDHVYDDRIEGDYKYRLYPPFCSFKLKVYHGLVRIYTSWGTNEYRWVPGLYLLLRLAFILAFMYSDTIMVQLNIQMILSIISANFFFAFRPYIRSRYNVIDGTLFLLLAMILSLSIFRHYRSIASLSDSPFVLVLQNFLVFLPFLWITVHITYMIYKQQGKIIQKMKQCCRSNPEGERENLIQNDIQS